VPEDITIDGLIIKVPTQPKSVSDIPFNNTRAIVPPDELTQRDRAVESLDQQTTNTPPIIAVN
jgi:hypothetical protein